MVERASHRGPQSLSRREMLFGSALGFGGLALCGMLYRDQEPSPPAPSKKTRAKQVIFLYMDGGPPQMDTFDPKPRLTRDDGKSYGKPRPGASTGMLMKSPFKFAKYGESGAEVSELFPHLAQCVDQLAIVRSMVSDYTNHATAGYFLNTGSPKQGFPSLGSWINYGLGSACEDLPGFIVLESGQIPEGGLSTFGNGFLPAKFQPTVLRHGPEPIENIAPANPASGLQANELEYLRKLNQEAQPVLRGESEFEALVANYELAYRMQAALPKLLDHSRETAATLALYGIGDKDTEAFGTQCLLARQLVEQGVRFVQLLPPKQPNIRHWDQHINLESDLRVNARAVDKPIAALLSDLQNRGLLDETLVIWGGEFGRTPTAQVIPPSAPGRNHNPHGFTMWLAGGGVQSGLIYGATDDVGHKAVENRVHIHDLQATILHLLGIDHTKLTFRHSGRDFRLTDVYGNVVEGLFA